MPRNFTIYQIPRCALANLRHAEVAIFVILMLFSALNVRSTVLRNKAGMFQVTSCSTPQKLHKGKNGKTVLVELGVICIVDYGHAAKVNCNDSKAYNILGSLDSTLVFRWKSIFGFEFL